jgi:2,3-bisphosphoglycerate-independent phosphoglycerate mutase
MNIKNRISPKIVYVLLDGVADLPDPRLGGLTPLAAARTPNMDSLAKNGCMGEVTTVGEGIAPQSDIAVFNMLGYNFGDQEYVGRGVIESIGSNIRFRNGDLALRGNFATVDNKLQIIDRRAGRDIQQAEAAEICKTLKRKIMFSDKDVSVVIRPTIAHRVCVRFRHAKMKFSEKITNTDPAYERINGMGIAATSQENMHINKSYPEESTKSAVAAARFVNEFSEQVIGLLEGHPVNKNRAKLGKKPVNAILLRDAGSTLPKLEHIGKKYRFDMASIVDMPVEIGISKVLKMSTLRAGKISDYETKATVVAENLDNHDGIYVHLKGPDEFGHDGDAIGKKVSIEEIDRSFFGLLRRKVGLEEATFVISSDHSTPCIAKAHSADPVPVLFSGKSVRRDGSARFTEKYASEGSIGHLKGSVVLKTALEMVGVC